MRSRAARVGTTLPLALAVLGLACGAMAGCGAARGSPRAYRAPGPRAPTGPAVTSLAERDALEAYVARVRVLTQQAAPGRQRTALPSVESIDPALRTALAALAASPGPREHRGVAAAYRRAGIADQAFDHYTAAVRLDRTDSAGYEGLAQIWRDWGWPHLGLVEAYRAIFHEPRSPTAHNTLGTLLQALGQHEAARHEYKKALGLSPTAAYALNNVCTLDMAAGRLDRAREGCRRALELDPSLLAARRNLAIIGAAGPATEPRAADRIGVPGASTTSAGAKPPGE